MVMFNSPSLEEKAVDHLYSPILPPCQMKPLGKLSRLRQHKRNVRNPNRTPDKKIMMPFKIKSVRIGDVVHKFVHRTWVQFLMPIEWLTVVHNPVREA